MKSYRRATARMLTALALIYGASQLIGSGLLMPVNAYKPVNTVQTATPASLGAPLVAGIRQQTQSLPATVPMTAEERDVITTYERASKSVVTIQTLVNGRPSSGAGVIVSTVGHIVTSQHVVATSNRIQVSLATGERYEARLVATSRDNNDLALLKIDAPHSLPALQLGNSAAARVGQRVLAIGHPFGFERTLTMGIISRVDVERNRLQTDAALNPGNSGGPLLDAQGRLLGINAAIFNPSNASNIGLGFAVPVDTVRQWLEGLVTAANA